jgi:hypothetical protein
MNEKRNPRRRLADDIGLICPELKPEIEKLQRPPPGPYAPGALFGWLCSSTVTILVIVLSLGKRMLQDTLERDLEDIDRPPDLSPDGPPVCPCPKCGSVLWHYNGQGKRAKTFRSIFGAQTLSRYQAECPRCHFCFYPLDCILGISPSVKLLPVLQSLVVFLGTHLPLREAAAVLKMALRIHMSPETIRAATQQVGKAVVRRQRNFDWQAELEILRDGMKEAEGECTLELSVDGAMVPLNKKPKAEPESHKEARSASFRVKDITGKLLAKLTISRLTELSSFLVSIGALLDECRETLGVKTIVLAGDGARWIWQFGKDNMISRTVLDWYHLRSYFVALRDAAKRGKTAARRERLEQIEDALWSGRVEDALNALKGFRARSVAEKKAKKDLARYIGNNREHIINYGWNWCRHKIVGSGAIEGAQQKSIHDRLRCSGMRWSEQGADYMMAARCTELNSTADQDVRGANLAA